jgi:hypothetical protein
MSRNFLHTGLIGLLAAGAPALALAGGDVSLEEVTYENWSHPKLGDALPVGGPVIRVFSEGGDRFDFVGHTNEPVHFFGLLSGACPRINKISALEFKVAQSNAPVSHPDGRGAWFSRIGAIDVPHSELQTFDAVRACNDKLKTLAAETGRSKRDLVSQGFGIHYPDRIEGRAVLLCTGRNNSDSDTENLDLWVDCVGNPKAGEPEAPTMKAIPAKLSPFITGLTYEVDRPSWVGKCPVGLKFTGSITTSRAGTVKYRTVGHDGSTSPTYTLTFGAAGTKDVGTWSETVAEPKASETLAAGPDTKGPDVAGWRRLEIVEPAGFAPSPPVDYSVTCQDQPLKLQAAPVATPKPARIKQ